MPIDSSPTSRALLALELVQGSPGITADRLADKLGVSERAARRYVGILREAGIPIESVRGPYGGYRLGRGLRLPPLTFSATEALGLVMAVLDGHHAASDPTDPVGSALGKIMRALPEPVAAQAEAVRRTTRTGARPGRRTPGSRHRVHAGAGVLGPAAGAARLPLGGRLGVGHRGRPVGGRRAARPVVPPVPLALRRRPAAPTAIDRVRDVQADSRTPSARPPTSTRSRCSSSTSAVGWEYEVDVVIDAAVDDVARRRPPHPRPARAGRRGHHPAGRQHQQPDLVRRAARGGPGAVPGRRRRGPAGVRAATSAGGWPPRAADSGVAEHAEEVASGSRRTTKSATSGWGQSATRSAPSPRSRSISARWSSGPEVARSR